MSVSEDVLTAAFAEKNAWPGTLSKGIGVLVILALGLIPVYKFGSGGFQPVDAFIVMLMITALFVKDVHEDIKKHVYLLLPFIIWAVLVNLGYYLSYKADVSLMLLVTVAYNFCVLWCFTTIFTEVLSKKGIGYIYLGLTLALILVFTVKGHREWEGARSSYSFNNPNQLAFFCIFAYSVILLLMQYRKDYNINDKVYYIFDIIILLTIQYLLWKALSRAGLVASMVLTLALVRKIFSKELFIPVSVVISVLLIFFLVINPTFIQDRLASRDQESISEGALERRIGSAVLYPMRNLKGIKVIIGTGALFVERENPMRFKGYFTEVHNMLGHVLWVYGLIGLLLFVPWLIKSVWEARILRDGLFIWAAFLAFGIGGVVVRSRVFWIIQGLLLALVGLKLRNEKQRGSSDAAVEIRGDQVESKPPI